MNFKQISYVYVARVIEDTKVLHLTQKEKDEGSEICWFEPAEALKKMSECYDKVKASEYSSVYSTKIIIKRDMCILQKYLESLNGNI